MNMRVWEPYCVATEHNEHMHFTSLRLLRQCCYNVLLQPMNEGVRTLLCRYWTQPVGIEPLVPNNDVLLDVPLGTQSQW